jgi:hypothetical protein
MAKSVTVSMSENGWTKSEMRLSMHDTVLDFALSMHDTAAGRVFHVNFTLSQQLMRVLLHSRRMMLHSALDIRIVRR